MKYIQVVLAFIIIIPALIISMFVAIFPSFVMRLIGLNKAADQWMYINAVNISKVILFSLGTKVVTHNKELIPPKGSPVCFVANHQSAVDIPVVAGFLHVWAGFITKAELKKIPIVSSWIKAIHCVYIDRKSPRSSIEAILKGVDNIRNGIPMFIFPEGTRSKNGRVNEFKSGALKLATRAKAIVVPITIEGTRAVFEDRKGISIPKITLTVNTPIDTSLLDEEGLKELPTTVFNSITHSLSTHSNQ